MTCIVGIRHGKGVVLAGDSVGVDGGGGAQMRRDAKVFSINKHVAIGYTSSFRMGQLLRYNLALPAIVDAIGGVRTDDLFSWAVKEFIPACRSTFKEGGYMKENGREEGGYFLLAVRDRLFEVQGDFQVAEPDPQYTATGSGEPYALGALHALVGPDAMPVGEKKAREVATAALAAAVFHSAYVRPPFQFVGTEP